MGLVFINPTSHQQMGDIDAVLRKVPGFPKPEVDTFLHAAPILARPDLRRALLVGMLNPLLHRVSKQQEQVVVLAAESRGMGPGWAIADALKCGLVYARKPGKTPSPVISVKYTLEYGTDTIEAEACFLEGKKVIIVDDLLATGGTAVAIAKLVKKAGGEVIAFSFMMEIENLEGRAKLDDVPTFSFLHYSEFV